MLKRSNGRNFRDWSNSELVMFNEGGGKNVGNVNELVVFLQAEQTFEQREEMCLNETSEAIVLTNIVDHHLGDGIVVVCSSSQHGGDTGNLVHRGFT